MNFLFKGEKLKSSQAVKMATIIFNVAVGVLVGLSQSGVISISTSDINATADHARGIAELLLPYILAGANVFTHVSTTESIGLKKKKIA